MTGSNDVAMGNATGGGGKSMETWRTARPVIGTKAHHRHPKKQQQHSSAAVRHHHHAPHERKEPAPALVPAVLPAVAPAVKPVTSCVSKRKEKLKPLIERSTAKRKTTLCMMHKRGKCSRSAAMCAFAHGEDDLRPRAEAGNTSSVVDNGPWGVVDQFGDNETDLCWNWLVSGCCRFGSSCVYVHDPRLEKTTLHEARPSLKPSSPLPSQVPQVYAERNGSTAGTARVATASSSYLDAVTGNQSGARASKKRLSRRSNSRDSCSTSSSSDSQLLREACRGELFTPQNPVLKKFFTSLCCMLDQQGHKDADTCKRARLSVFTAIAH